MAEKTFSQKAVESIGLRLIVVVAGAVGTAVLAWYTAHSAWLHALPFYEIGPMIAALALIGVLVIYVSIVIIGRVQRQMAEVGGCEAVWLHDHAKGDSRILDELVRVESCDYGNTGLFVPSPEEAFVVFGFNVFNASVFEISIDHKIEGHISFGLRPLRQKLEIMMNPYKPPRNLRHGRIGHFMLRQSLSRTEAEYIKANTGNTFTFDALIIKVNGGDDFQFLKATPLDFGKLPLVTG